MGKRLKPGYREVGLIAALSIYLWVPVVAMAYGALWFVQPEMVTGTGLLSVVIITAVVAPTIILWRYASIVRGLTMAIHPDRYELYRGEELVESVRWVDVTDFQPSLYLSHVICGDRRTPFLHISEGPFVFQKAKAWLGTVAGQPPLLRFFHRHRITSTVIFVACLVAFFFIPRPTPDELGTPYHSLFLSFGGVAQVAMIFAMMGWGLRNARRQERKTEPLVLEEPNIVEPGVTYWHEIGLTRTSIRIEGSDLVVDGVRRYPLSESRDFTSLDKVRHQVFERRVYGRGKDQFILYPDELVREGEEPKGSALGNQLIGTTFVAGFWAVFASATWIGAAYVANVQFGVSQSLALVVGASVPALALAWFGKLWSERRGYTLAIHTDRLETLRFGEPQATVRFDEIERVDSTVSGAWIITKSGRTAFIPETFTSSIAYDQLKSGLLGFRDVRARKAKAALALGAVTLLFVAATTYLVSLDPNRKGLSPLETFAAFGLMGAFSLLGPPLLMLASSPRPLRIDEGLLEPGVYENRIGHYEVRGDTLIATEEGKVREFPAKPVQTSLDQSRHHVYKNGRQTIKLPLDALTRVTD